MITGNEIYCTGNEYTEFKITVYILSNEDLFIYSLLYNIL